MKVLRMLTGWLAAFQFLLAGFAFTGCQTSDSIVFSAVPGEVATGGSGASGPLQTYTGVIRVGELVTIRFSGISIQLPTHEERVKEDGTLTLPDVGVVKAADKSAGDLQRELTESYRKYYKTLVITVVVEGRVYHVGGEVRRPGPMAYLGKTTITTAVQAAGDFTEYGNKKKVWLTRPGQKPIRVNVVEALKDPSKDVEVFPGDRIDVPRRYF